MRVTYDRIADAAYIYVKDDIGVGEAPISIPIDFLRAIIVADFSEKKLLLLGIEILDAKSYLPKELLKKTEAIAGRKQNQLGAEELHPSNWGIEVDYEKEPDILHVYLTHDARGREAAVSLPIDPDYSMLILDFDKSNVLFRFHVRDASKHVVQELLNIAG